MNWKAVRKYIFVAVAGAGLLTLTACGGGGGGVVQPPPPQGDFTNGSFINNYAFFYQGSDAFGNPLAVSGELVADGQGHITSGLIDVDIFNSLPLVAAQILSTSTYSVNADGQTSVTLNLNGAITFTLQLTLASSAHGLITQFDVNGSGSGTIDAQNAAQLSTALTGHFAINVSGVDGTFEETTISGNLLVNAGGTIPSTQSVWDVVEAGLAVDKDDTGVNGSLTPDALNAGHGTISISSPTANINGAPLVFSYYVVDATHLKIIEIDNAFFTAGEAFAAPGSSTQLANASYAYTASGESSRLTPQAVGGVFVSNGSGGITGGVQDLNRNASGNNHIKQTLQASTATADASLARIDLILDANGTNFEYAAYPTLNGRVLLSEIDGKQAVAGGTAFQQTAVNPVQGSYAINLSGLAVNQSVDRAQDVVGQVTIASGGATTGTLQINNIFVAPPVPNVVLDSKSMLAALDNPVTGRGNPFTLQSTELGGSGFTLSYYVVDDETVLLLEMDSIRVTTGLMLKQ
jgi:hypothetical protein